MPLALEFETVTLQTTLVSLFEPLLVNVSVKVGAGLAGIVFVEPAWSVVPPTLTELSSCPCVPGATCRRSCWSA